MAMRSKAALRREVARLEAELAAAREDVAGWRAATQGTERVLASMFTARLVVVSRERDQALAERDATQARAVRVTQELVEHRGRANKAARLAADARDEADRLQVELAEMREWYGEVSMGRDVLSVQVDDLTVERDEARAERDAMQARVAGPGVLVRRFGGERPEIVCLCGSTRFAEDFRAANLRLTVQGRIVLSIGCDTKSDADLMAAGDLTEDLKARLDELHKRKIDLADWVLVLNVGGYIGKSTRSEIEYAERIGRRVRYLEPESVECDCDDPQVDYDLHESEHAAQCEVCDRPLSEERLALVLRGAIGRAVGLSAAAQSSGELTGEVSGG